MSHRGVGPGAESVVEDFEAKLCKNLHGRDMLNNVFSDHADAHIEFDSDEVSKTFQVVRNIRKLDSNGISICEIKFIFQVHTQYVTKARSMLASNCACIDYEHIQSRVFGMESACPTPGECRAILPLTAMLTLLDCMLSARLGTWCKESLRIEPWCLVGNTRRTQCLDAAFTAQLVIEKGLDVHSSGAIAVADICKYYDSISIHKFACFAIKPEEPRTSSSLHV